MEKVYRSLSNEEMISENGGSIIGKIVRGILGPLGTVADIILETFVRDTNPRRNK